MNKKRIQQIKCLFTLFFVVCASFYATRSYAQNNAVTIRLSGVSMERVMNEIENQTNYLFLSNKDVDINSVVSVDVEARPLSEALAQMVRGTDVVYRFDGKYILLSKADRRPVTVKGVVTDADGAPVIGASVIVKGTTVGASTNTDGSFSLQVPPPAENAVLTVTYLGYEPVDVTVGSRTDFRITLRDSAVAVENVVVTALGSKRQEKALSYNVQQVKSEELTTVKDANFMNSLVGKVAGVQINSGASGPGASARVVMRGEKSIEKGNNVLYVIDGIPMYNHSFGGDGGTYAKQAGSESAADINPEDIESINMLTGPSAAALYGSDAANGVVVINTKRGVKDRTVVTVSNSTTFSKVYRLPDMQNSYGTSSGLMNWGEKYASTFDAKKFFNTGTNIINSVSVSTGNEKNQTYISASTTNTAGIIPENTYDRYNFTARNTTSFAKDKLVLDLGASFIIQHDENMVTQGKYYNPLPALYLFPRSDDFDEIRLFERWDPVRGYMVQYWPYGEGAHSLQNPYWIQNRMNRETSKRRYMLNASLRWNITDWMNVSGRVRVDNSEYRIKQKLYASTLTTFCGTNGGYEDQTQHDRSFYGDVMLNIDKTFGDDWTLNANIGASINDQRYEQAGVAGDLLLTNHFAMNNLNYQEKFKPLQEGWHDQTQAIFASVEVGWRSMLYLTVTGRNDWASQIAGSPSKSFFYPSVGLSWVPSSTWDLGNAFSYLKLRGSIASVGLPFPRFLTTPTYEYDATGKIWKDKTHYPIGDLKPERTITYEVGIDARLWKNISLSASWYSADTKNQTFDPALPPSSSYTTIYLQTGHVRNTGVELSLGYSNQWRDFGWSSNFTFSWNKNEIVDLASGALNPVTGQPLNLSELDIKGLGKAKYILKQGGTLGDLYTTSDLKFNDNGYVEVDKAGNLLLTDEGEQIYLGSVFPSENLAWRNDFRYKGINLGLLFTGRIGGICYSATQANMDLYGVSEVSAAARDAGGVLINGREMVDAQKWYQAIGSQSGLPQYYTYSATNFRLQELSLGYTLPRKWFRNKMVLTVSFVGRNLWMIYCKAPFDPEAVASTGLSYQGIDYFMMPSLRSLGFNVKFEF